LQFLENLVKAKRFDMAQLFLSNNIKRGNINFNFYNISTFLFLLEVDVEHKIFVNDTLIQGCQTRGPRKLLMRPSNDFC